MRRGGPERSSVRAGDRGDRANPGHPRGAVSLSFLSDELRVRPTRLTVPAAWPVGAPSVMTVPTDG
jgi:hypothetical protein